MKGGVIEEEKTLIIKDKLEKKTKVISGNI